MKIIVDIMSGDKAPLEQLRGAVAAANEYDKHSFVFVGKESTIRELASEDGLDIDMQNIEIVNSDEILTMEDEPLSVVREKKDSSMGIGLKLLAEKKGDAFVSAGNTGALHAGSTLIVRRIKGIKKSAIATILPFKNPTMLIDSGANIEVDPDICVQFARMATIYMSKILGVANPRVGLLNIGTEKTKGTKERIAEYEALSSAEGINFVGNVEGKELPFGICDVIVTDGFAGNIMLKTIEGTGAYLMENLKDVFRRNALTKVSALGVKSGLSRMKHSFSASEYGGAPMLGLSKTVIKAHGSSDALAMKNAIRQAINCVENGVTYEIAKRVAPESVIEAKPEEEKQ